MELVLGPKRGSKTSLTGIDFSAERAAEIHIPLKELLSAIEKWAERPGPVPKKLVALYRGDYDHAALDFKAALNSASASEEQLEMSVAYAEFKSRQLRGVVTILEGGRSHPAKIR